MTDQSGNDRGASEQAHEADYFDRERALAAPPKPAPDAMREALEKIKRRSKQYAEIAGDSLMGPYKACKNIHEIADAALSAPVPPPDGAPVSRDTNMFSRLANEPPAVIPEGYSAPLDIRTASEIEHDRIAAKRALPPSDDVRSALDREEKYLLEHFDAECGIMPGDVEGSFHRLRAALRSAPVSVPATGIWMNAYADAHLQLSAFKTAVANLVNMARTSGGVAGRDEGLCAACDDVERLIVEAKRLPAAPAVGVTREAIARTLFDHWKVSNPSYGWIEYKKWYQDHWLGFADAVLALRSPAPDVTVSEPDAWLVDGPRPLDSSEVFLLHDKALAAFKDWGKRITPLYTSPQHVGSEAATVSEFKNEIGNTIRITIEGPTNKSTNDLTPTETAKLNEALTKHFTSTVSARDAVIESALCSDCPPRSYADTMRCTSCPRRSLIGAKAMTLIAALCLGPAYLIDRYPRAVPAISLAALAVFGIGQLMLGWGKP